MNHPHFRVAFVDRNPSLRRCTSRAEDPYPGSLRAFTTMDTDRRPVQAPGLGGHCPHPYILDLRIRFGRQGEEDLEVLLRTEKQEGAAQLVQRPHRTEADDLAGLLVQFMCPANYILQPIVHQEVFSDEIRLICIRPVGQQPHELLLATLEDVGRELRSELGDMEEDDEEDEEEDDDEEDDEEDDAPEWTKAPTRSRGRLVRRWGIRLGIVGGAVLLAAVIPWPLTAKGDCVLVPSKRRQVVSSARPRKPCRSP